MQMNVGSILDKGGVDHGMLPRRSGSRGILGSHPLAAECTKACSTAAWISKYLAFLSIMTACHQSTSVVDRGEGRVNERQEAKT